MSDNPYAPPDGRPSGGPAPEPAPPGLARRQGLAALGLGAATLACGLAMVIGILVDRPSEVVGTTLTLSLLLGVPTILLGAALRARTRDRGGSALVAAATALAVTGLVLTVSGYGFVQEDLQEHEDCLEASITFAGDRACQERLEDALDQR